MKKWWMSQQTIRKVFRTPKDLMRFIRRQEGITIVEYAVAAALIAASIVVTFRLLGIAILAIIAAVAGSM